MRRIASVMLAVGLGLVLVGCAETTVRGPENKSLTLVVPRSLAIHQGQTEAVEVGIQREKVPGRVRVWISQLPGGVTARESSMTVETDAATFVLTADETAGRVAEHVVMVTAEGPEGMRATGEIRLTVK